jgi:hypothetical protein
MTARLEPSEIISIYLRAFEAANGHLNVKLTYERGWFCFRYHGISAPIRYRRGAIMRMTKRLVASPEITHE